MLTPKTLRAKQRQVIRLLGGLATQVALAGLRQGARKLVLNVSTGANYATFYIYTISDGGAKIDWADNLGFDVNASYKNPICFDAFSLRQDDSFQKTVELLQNALETAKSL